MNTMFKEQYEKLVAKFGKRNVTIGVVVIGVIVVWWFVGGIGNRADDRAAERAIEAATGGRVDVDSDNGTVTVKTDEGTWSTSDKLPDDWPADVPVFSGAKVVSSAAVAGQQGNGSYAALETTAGIADVVAWYKAQVPAKGWTVVTEATVDGSSMLSATKDTRALTVTVSAEDGTVTIGLMVGNK